MLHVAEECSTYPRGMWYPLCGVRPAGGTRKEECVETRQGIDAVMLTEVDNVATALRELTHGEEARVGVGERTFLVPVSQTIAFGHKLAVTDIRSGDEIRKYGEVIGRATQDIPSGTHAHVHNVESLRGRGDLEAARKSNAV
jgi:altronate dehydratase small subunit